MRVGMLLHRHNPRETMAKKEVFDDFEFESVSKRVFMRGNSVMLMQKEFELALLLFKHMSRPLSRSNTRS